MNPQPSAGNPQHPAARPCGLGTLAPGPNGQEPNQHCAVLILTCERYAAIAGFSVRAICAQWTPRPPIYVCGTSRPVGPEALMIPPPHTGDLWIPTLLHACRYLLDRGVRRAYLILDDQPPFGPCHPHHLNITLPAWMDLWRATNISLIGWDSVFRSRGTFLRSAHGDVLRLDPALANRFTLHPALWDLPALHLIASTFSETLPQDAQTPWGFEHAGRDSTALFTRSLNTGFYRPCGGRMSARPRGFPPQWLVEIEARWRLRHISQGRHMTGPRRLWTRLLEAVGGPASRAFHGPYPHYYSGLLARGRPNTPALRHMGRSASPTQHAEATATVAAWVSANRH